METCRKIVIVINSFLHFFLLNYVGEEVIIKNYFRDKTILVPFVCLLTQPRAEEDATIFT